MKSSRVVLADLAALRIADGLSDAQRAEVRRVHSSLERAFARGSIDGVRAASLEGERLLEGMPPPQTEAP